MQLFNKDCRDVNVTADIVVTDPPYKLTSGGMTTGEGIGEWNLAKGYDNKGQLVTCDISWDEIMDVAYNSLEKNGEAYIMSNNRNLADAEIASRKVGFKFHNLLIWDKGTKTPNRNGMNSYEVCLYLFKGRTRNWNDCGQGNIFRVPNLDKGNGHPTQKPVDLMAAWIRLSTDKGQCVYDPFMGVASTGVACIRNDRNFIGCELEKKWFDVAEKRIEEEINNKQGFLI